MGFKHSRHIAKYLFLLFLLASLPHHQRNDYDDDNNDDVLWLAKRGFRFAEIESEKFR
jgi:hypothetical protein